MAAVLLVVARHAAGGFTGVRPGINDWENRNSARRPAGSPTSRRDGHGIGTRRRHHPHCREQCRRCGDSRGACAFSKYVIKATLSGFRDLTSENILVSSGQTTTLHVQMTLSSGQRAGHVTADRSARGHHARGCRARTSRCSSPNRCRRAGQLSELSAARAGRHARQPDRRQPLLASRG